jgi:hypothetical protein
VTLRLNGSTSGYTEIDAPAVAGSNTLVLPTGAGSAYQVVRNGATAGSLEFTDKIVSGTAVASTSGTSIDFTGIPSWVKRVTVMLNGVSTNGSSNYRIQFGAGSIQTTGYNSNCLTASSVAAATTTNVTAGFDIGSISTAGATLYGSAIFSLLGSNSWVCQGQFSNIGDSRSHYPAGAVALSGTLDRVRITTVNGTDTFDAGSINILYE